MPTTNKTQATPVDPRSFIEAVDHPVCRADAMVLDDLYRRITGWRPRMWGPTIVGYGSYHYVYDSGREGDSLAAGFSPRKANLSLYIVPGYQDYDAILSRLGKYKMGKSCLYINKLSDVSMGVLEELIRTGMTDLAKIYTVTAT
ncbi:DUF1801 domain-containing protein [Octadecabacter sp.]|nr:DUF1801 domain-containing protein [Octadecabacter sp.]